MNIKEIERKIEKFKEQEREIECKLRELKLKLIKLNSNLFKDFIGNYYLYSSDNINYYIKIIDITEKSMKLHQITEYNDDDYVISSQEFMSYDLRYRDILENAEKITKEEFDSIFNSVIYKVKYPKVKINNVIFDDIFFKKNGVYVHTGEMSREVPPNKVYDLYDLNNVELLEE